MCLQMQTLLLDDALQEKIACFHGNPNPKRNNAQSPPRNKKRGGVGGFERAPRETNIPTVIVTWCCYHTLDITPLRRRSSPPASTPVRGSRTKIGKFHCAVWYMDSMIEFRWTTAKAWGVAARATYETLGSCVSILNIVIQPTKGMSARRVTRAKPSLHMLLFRRLWDAYSDECDDGTCHGSCKVEPPHSMKALQ